MGWCHEQDEYLLVYEYMPKGSLHDHLFGNRRTLPWNVRYSTALALASALKYLHEVQSHVFVNTQLRTQRSNPVGTPGYVAPEFRRDGRATTQSDMYSFGVVALEIACGVRNFRNNNDHRQLLKDVWQKYKAGKILDASDKRLKKEFDPKEIECLMIVGLWCVHPTANDRPTAGRVIQYLNFQAPLPNLPPALHDPEFLSNSDINGRNTQ
ncbi:hypothetical protein GH714_035760 [Hevea brasiliensis]|uniref:Protein kinase domain-containing protein n=1 Tax=Hevea brasiliensis TaxID=3981 RepID=A0A6A6N9G9_HEVBR|nr:hypothetical protein GH714_035760 [Hevea brasiliensis]